MVGGLTAGRCAAFIQSLLSERAKFAIKLLSGYGNIQRQEQQISIPAVVVVYGIGPSPAYDWVAAAVTVLQRIARFFFAYAKGHAD